jgi:hypothetical protein
MTASQPAEWAALSFATNLEEYHHERKRPEHCQLHHLLRMLQRNSARCRLHPEGAEYVEHFCGLDCYERFQARAKAATESDIAPVPGGSQPSERTLFILDWLQSVELRRRVHAGLNKGEARNALARAVFFYRLGEIRDRSFEQQRYRASGLNLVTAAIVLWNTVYLERATSALRGNGTALDDTLLQYLSPLGWEHINLTGDYLWRSSAKVGAGKFRPLRPLPPA